MTKTFLLLATLAFALPAFADLPPLQAVVIDGKALVADPSFMTVYTYDPDAPGVSNCYDRCARAWPPVLAPAGAEIQAPLSIVVRKDGAKQLAVGGKPIYTYVGDSARGEANGDGLGGVWHVVPNAR